jgi:formylmethanofuran dehydrogenase subunit B
MIKLTKKHAEIIEKVKQIENETKKTVYLMYQQFSGKIHAVNVKLKENNEIDVIENKGIICTHNVAMTLQNKGIIVPEVVGQCKQYANEDNLYDFVLCKVNPSILQEAI